MTYRVDPMLSTVMERYGGDSINECFNCGNCTAVCSLTEEDTAYPRKYVRYMQLGLKDLMLESPEPWLCYYCGDCSDSCPREAEPGKLMAAARRWQIGQYDITGIARLFATSASGSFVVVVILAFILGLFLTSGSSAMALENIALWDYLNAEVIHNIGLIVIGLVVLFGLIGVLRMGAFMSRGNPRKHMKAAGGIPKSNGAKGDWLGSAIVTAFQEVLGHRMYIACDQDKEMPTATKPWFLHGATAWGFLGLLLATILHWVLDIVGLKETATWVPALSIPIRILGIVAGLFLMYGTTGLLLNRLGDKPTPHFKDSTASDWLFLVLLWLAGLTGFITLIGEFVTPSTLTYYMLLIHVVLSMELVLLAPFTKFAHVFYRTVAVYIEQQRALARL